MNVGFTVTSTQKFSRQVRQIRYRGQIGGNGLDAIEVGSDADVIRADELDDVIDMIDKSLNANWTQPLSVFTFANSISRNPSERAASRRICSRSVHL